MRRLQHLKSSPGATRASMRKGRGRGSKGRTCGSGHKGQNSRSSVSPWFEGGQMPLQRRLSHKGFSNARFAVKYQIVNIGMLDRFDADIVVTPAVLKEAGLISSSRRKVKILGSGTITKKLTVQVHAFSTTAAKVIIEAGGKVEVIK